MAPLAALHSASARRGNIQRAEWRNHCRQALSDHLSRCLWEVSGFESLLTPTLEIRLGIEISPAEVRLQPRTGDGYQWVPIKGKENFFKRSLFQKPLSKLSVGAYMELCRGVVDPTHKFFEAMAESVHEQLKHAKLRQVCEKEVRISVDVTRQWVTYIF